MTGQLQCFGWICLSHAGAVEQVRVHGYLPRGFYTSSKKKSGKMGIFHKLSNKIGFSLITVSLEDAQEIINLERDDIKK